MSEIVIAVISGLLVVAGGQQLTKGGRKWRALTMAKHELEVVQCLPDSDELGNQLRARAHERIELYLRDKKLTWRSQRRRGVVMAGVGLPIVILMALLGDQYDLSFWVLFGMGAFLGAVFALVDELYLWITRPPPLEDPQGQEPATDQ